jgi:hypothetical protein
MDSLRTALLALGAVLAFAATGSAATLHTAPARADYPSAGRTLYCDIRNVSSGPGVVTIDVLSYAGTALRTVGPLTLDPNEATATSDSGVDGVSCRFTVSGSPKRWRGVAMYDNGTDYTVAIPAY